MICVSSLPMRACMPMMFTSRNTPPTSITIVMSLALTNFANSPARECISGHLLWNTNSLLVTYAKSIAAATDMILLIVTFTHSSSQRTEKTSRFTRVVRPPVMM